MNHKTDPYTKEVFVPRRRDQVFASKDNKDRYNNEKAARKRAAKASIRHILDKNWDILNTLLQGEDEVIVGHEELTWRQFSSMHITHRMNTSEGELICVYNLGYKPMGNGRIRIVRYE